MLKDNVCKTITKLSIRMFPLVKKKSVQASVLIFFLRTEYEMLNFKLWRTLGRLVPVVHQCCADEVAQFCHCLPLLAPYSGDWLHCGFSLREQAASLVNKMKDKSVKQLYMQT